MADEVLRKNRKVLLSTINQDELVVESLYSDTILNERQYQEIKAEKVPIKAAELLLDFLHRGDCKVFMKFCEILDSDYPWLAELLRSDAQEIGLKLDDKSCDDDVDKLFLTFDKEDTVPTECQLMRISKALLCSSWQSILYELGLQTSDIDHCKRSNSAEKLQCKSGLTLWLRRYGKLATFKTLFAACKNADIDINCAATIVRIAAGE